MTHKYLIAAAVLTGALAFAQPAEATGKMKCDVAKNEMRSMDDLKKQLVEQGWQVNKAKEDGGCYEVYGTDPEGRRVEAYFDPKTFQKLYVSQRGKVLFRAEGR